MTLPKKVRREKLQLKSTGISLVRATRAHERNHTSINPYINLSSAWYNLLGR